MNFLFPLQNAALMRKNKNKKSEYLKIIQSLSKVKCLEIYHFDFKSIIKE